jgi:hypothetical protein
MSGEIWNAGDVNLGMHHVTRVVIFSGAKSEELVPRSLVFSGNRAISASDSSGVHRISVKLLGRQHRRDDHGDSVLEMDQ